ncbi:MAG: succinoglycan biosynthesis transport protein [Bradyrhizobiaceae bacterium]|nr:MAG: succinoglycan biosynthesis transport protein [Bradyrhizobiaceae bacterium]
MTVSEGKSYVTSPVTNGQHLAGVLLRRVRLICGVILLCALAGAAYVILVPQKYIASGRILLDPIGLQIVGTGVAPRDTTRDTSAIDAESQIYVITSRAVFDRVVATEHLETDPLFGAKPRGLISSLLVALGIIKPIDPHALALRQLDRSVSVSRSANSFVVNVNVATEDRDTSARVANAIMTSYIDEENRAKAETAKRAGTSLDTRLEALQTRLRESEERYERYRSSHGIVVANGQPILEKQVTDLSGQLTTAQARVNELQSALDQIRDTKGGMVRLDAIPEAFRSGSIEILRNRYAAAKQLETNLVATLGPRHPDYTTAAAQAAEARRLLDQAMRDIVQSISAELERAKATVKGLNAQINTINSQISSSNEASVRLRELGREVDASRAIYESFLGRSRELAEQQRLENTNTRVLSYASPPLEPGGASPILILLASVLMGIGLGTAAAWFMDQLSAPRTPGRPV